MNLRIRIAGPTVLILLAMISTVSSFPAQAQNAGITPDDDKSPNNARALPLTVPPITLGRMLVAGQGMGVLQLGTTFARVLIDFGRPIEERRTGLLGKVRNWIYSADDGSTIILSGKDAVDSISIRGGLNSTFATIDGITFGADQSLVLTYYGAPDTTKNNEFIYSNGISFGLTDRGLVNIITVSTPEN